MKEHDIVPIHTYVHAAFNERMALRLPSAGPIAIVIQRHSSDATKDDPSRKAHLRILYLRCTPLY